MAEQMQSAPRLITAEFAGVSLIDAAERRARLDRVDTMVTLKALAAFQAKLDAATLASESTVGIESAPFTNSRWAGSVLPLLNQGHRLTLPQTLVGLIREVIRSDPAGTEGLAVDDFLAMLVSINQEQDSVQEALAQAGVSEPAEFDMAMRGMPAEAQKLLGGMMAVPEGAGALFNAVQLPEYVKYMTFEFWYSPWSKADTALGATPADCFREVMGFELDDLLRAGDIIADMMRRGQARVPLDRLVKLGVRHDIVEYIRKNMVLDLAGFREKLAAEPTEGDPHARRFTFTRHPFFDAGDGEVIALRAWWAIDRFFGQFLEFDLVAELSERAQDKLAKQFRAATTFQFEAIVGRMIARIARHSSTFDLIVTEPEMQTAWKERKGAPPSVCDWMVPTQRVTWLLDATYRPLMASLAEGVGSGADHAKSLNQFMTEGKTGGKVGQFDSVIDLLTEKGWDGETYPQSLFLPCVVVPDSGLPSTMLNSMLVPMVSQNFIEKHQGRARPPAVLAANDLVTLEGYAEYTDGRDIAELLAAWRIYAVLSLDMFVGLIWGRPDRPVPSHVLSASKKLDSRIHPLRS